MPESKASPRPYFPKNFFMTYADHNSDDHPVRMNVPNVDADEHASYETRPFYCFVDATELDGKRYLIADNGLKAELAYVDGSSIRKTKDHHWQTKYKVYLQDFDGEVILSLNDSTMRQQEIGFIVTGTPDDYTKLQSGSFEEGKHYVLTMPKKDRKESEGQPFGSVFTHKVFDFEPLRNTWDITKLDFDDPQISSGGDKEIFRQVDFNSRNYDQPGGNIVVPYGWKFDSRVTGSGKKTSSMVSSSADVMNSLRKSNGFNIGGSVDVDFGIVDVGAEFSVVRNDKLATKLEDMYTNEYSYTEGTYVDTEAGYVLDKINARLAGSVSKDGVVGEDGLLGQIEVLRNSARASADGKATKKAIAGCIANWGTHYCYAAVFGAKGFYREKLNKKEVTQLAEKEVDFSLDWSATVKARVLMVNASATGGQQTQEEQANRDKVTSVKNDMYSSFKCIGGGACDGGKPGSGGNRVPILFDLRPLSDLLGPPFFNDALTTLVLKDQLAEAIGAYAFHKNAYYGHAIRPPTFDIDFNSITVEIPKIHENKHTSIVEYHAHARLSVNGLISMRKEGKELSREEVIRLFSSGPDQVNVPIYTYDGAEYRTNSVIVTYDRELNPVPVEISSSVKLVPLGYYSVEERNMQHILNTIQEYNTITSLLIGRDFTTVDRDFSDSITSEFPDGIIARVIFNFHLKYVPSDNPVEKLRQLQLSNSRPASA